jgi:hypothetical protein
VVPAPIWPTSIEFDRLSGSAAIAAGIVAFLYAVAFIILVIAGVAPETGFALASMLLLVGGLLSAVALTGLFPRLWVVSPPFALLALLFGVGGTFGAAIHGAWDLAVTLHPPEGFAEMPNLPSEVDPRGLLTFGFSAVGILVASWLILRGGSLPRGLGYLGYLAAALLVIIYLARLIILDPTNPLVALPAALAGFIVNPAWYVWLGLTLRRLGSSG